MGPVVAFFGAVFLGVGAGASLAYTIAVQLTRIAILSYVSKKLAPKPDLSQSAADKLLTVRNTIQPQAFVYGEDMLSGPLIFGQVHGDNNKYLSRVVALTGREIDSFLAFRIDDEDIVIGSPGQIPDANDTVASGKYANVMVIETQLGTSTQTSLSTLTTDLTEWTSAHRCRGWSLFYTRMELVGGNDAYKNGAPQNLRALVKGHKVYDPRLDSTQVIDSTTSPVTFGSGAHRTATPSTWAWSDNPALCLADFLMWDEIGYGEEADRIDWELVATAADICEEQVDIPPAASPANTQNRYTCNFTFHADTQRQAIKDIIETAMMGRCIFSQGKWRMFAGAAYTPTVTLDETYLAGAIAVQAATENSARYNRVRGNFVDPDRNYTANPYPEQTNASYETADNMTKYRSFDWNACNNVYEAQRNAIIALKQSRLQKVVRFEGNWKCFQIQPGKTVNLSIAELNWTNKKFFVTEWELEPDGRGCSLTLVEELDSVWTDPAVGDYTTRTIGTLTPPTRPAIAVSDATINNGMTSPTYNGIRVGVDGRLYYSNSANVYLDNLVPFGEWLGSGVGPYYVRATVTAGALTSGTEDTWEIINQDRTWYSAVDDTVSPALTDGYAVVTLDFTDDITTSPVSVIASASFTLGELLIAQLSSVTAQETSTSVAAPNLWLGTAGDLRYNDDTVSPTTTTVTDEWYIGHPSTGIGAQYEARLSDRVFGGGATFLGWRPGGTVDDSWILIGNTSDMYYRLTRTSGSGVGTSTCNGLLEIRDKDTLEVVASARVYFSATITA